MCEVTHSLFVLPALQENDIFHVMCVRKHIDGLHGHDPVIAIHEVQVTGLCGGIATHVHDAFRCGF